MCNYSSTKPTSYESLFSTFGLPWPSKKHHRHLQLGLLNRRRAQLKELPKHSTRLVVVKSSSEIEMKNLKLYMENQSILEENDKLRKKAMLLHSENQALLSQLQKKVSEQNCSKTNH